MNIQKDSPLFQSPLGDYLYCQEYDGTWSYDGREGYQFQSPLGDFLYCQFVIGVVCLFYIWFQSPFGDFLYCHLKSIPNKAFALAVVSVPVWGFFILSDAMTASGDLSGGPLIKMFQSPLGDYLYCQE